MPIVISNHIEQSILLVNCINESQNVVVVLIHQRGACSQCLVERCSDMSLWWEWVYMCMQALNKQCTCVVQQQAIVVHWLSY